MAMTAEQKEYERQLSGWTYFLSLVRELLVVVILYVATKEISGVPDFGTVAIVWCGVWLARLVAHLLLRPWVKEHLKACVTFDLKTAHHYIGQLEKELEDEREQYLELLSNRSELSEELTAVRNELRKMQSAESKAESELFYTMVALDLAGITEEQVKEMRRKAAIIAE